MISKHYPIPEGQEEDGYSLEPTFRRFQRIFKQF